MARRRSSRSRRRKSQGIQISLDTQLDILGIILIALAGLTLLSLLSSTRGELTEAWIQMLRTAFGWGTYLTPVIFGTTGVWLIARRFEDNPIAGWDRFAGGVLLFLVLVTAFHTFTFPLLPKELAKAGEGGGHLGYWLSEQSQIYLGLGGSIFIIIVLGLISLLLMFHLSIAQLTGMVILLWVGITTLRDRLFPRRPRISGTYAPNTPSLPPPTPKLNGQVRGQQLILNGKEHHESASQQILSKVKELVPSSIPLVHRAPNETPPKAILRPKVIRGSAVWHLPSIDAILEEKPEPEISRTEIRHKARIIEETLNSFGIPAKVQEVNQGPTVTQFGVEPGYIERSSRNGEVRQAKVKVSKIMALSNDLALALSAPSIRIEAPIPGRPLVGIEVPNEQNSLVSLRGVLESEEFQILEGKLKLALGRDVSGQPVVADLGVMPHLLIAGATGSGKSVCVNSIITTLLMNHTPHDLQMIMLDPKRVELVAYDGIPHLKEPVVVEIEKMVPALKSATREMDRRYQTFSQAKVRNIDSYNRLMTKRGEKTMPFVIIVIDELADLMMVSPEEVEKTICRIAQMARATGIHLVIATQRPSVDVVTGLIKANFPARISFAVTSQVDSRVIVDTVGADKLLGRGDMLFMAPDKSSLLRLQGCYVSDHEIEKLTRFWKGARTPRGYPTPEPIDPHRASQRPLWGEMRERERAAQEAKQAPSTTSAGDDLYDRAVALVRKEGKASITLLQRRLRISLTRAARLIDELEDNGIISSAHDDMEVHEVFNTGG